MISLLIVTHVDFWRKGAGHRSRLTSLIGYIKDYFDITIVYAGTFNSRDREVINREFPSITIVPLEPHRTISFKEHGILFAEFIADKKFDIALIEYIEMAFVLPMLAETTFTILDTHDLVADRIRSFRDNGVHYSGIIMSEEEELNIFNCFDKVLLITDEDYQKIGHQAGFDRAMLVPHAPTLCRRSPRDPVRSIGFVGSEYLPNVEALTWFISNVWPSISHPLELNVYGRVCQRVQVSADRVNFHGFVDNINSIYDCCDIIINPVKFGAGLKIKNIEALACGLPLITTSHGAIGIEAGRDHCFVVADTPAAFVHAISKLVDDLDYRRQLTTTAYAFAQKNFSPSACYQPLLNCMLEYQLTE